MKISDILPFIGCREFVALDFETTGLSHQQDQVIEISAVRFIDGVIIDDYTTLVKPDKDIPENITKLTGISNEMVKDSPLISSAFPELIKFIEGRKIVGHNIDFDIGFIEKLSNKLGLDYSIEAAYDTLALSRSFLFSFSFFSLEYLSNYFNFKITASHRAKSDASRSGLLFLQLIEHMLSFPIQIFNDINLISSKKMNNYLLYRDILDYKNKSVDKDEFSPIISFDIKDNILIHESQKGNAGKNTIDEYFEENGILSSNWKDYSYRQEQHRFSSDIFDAFQDENVLVAEAGPGLGKTISYLIAGIKLSVSKKVSIVISTYTKALQDQLFYKDIPLLMDILDIGFKAVLLKGKNNYISIKKLNYILHNSHIIKDIKSIESCITLIIWSYFTKTGDISECLGFNERESIDLWRRLNASLDISVPGSYDISGVDFYDRMCKESKDANVLIVNHSFLYTDLSFGNSNLFSKSLLIIDEAHNLPSAIKEQLISGFSQYAFILSLRRLLKDINLVKDIDNSKFLKINADILDLKEQVIHSFNNLKDDFSSIYNKMEYNKTELLYNQEMVYSSEVDFTSLYKKIYSLIEDIQNIVEVIKKDDHKYPKTHLLNFYSILKRLDEIIKNVKIFKDNDNDYVKWYTLYKSSGENAISLNTVPIDISKYVKNDIFSKFDSFVLCSGTLMINDSFRYFLENVGLSEFNDIETTNKSYKSPFLYEEQMQIHIYKSEFDINSSQYIEEIADQICSLNKNLKKRIMVLCTSYKQVNALGKAIRMRLVDNENIFLQSSGAKKHRILENYKQKKDAILIGTSTFWEGIDLAGDLLEILIIFRIPFDNPSDPFNIVNHNMIKASGGDPFYDYQLPKVMYKIKQGIGRLIRSDRDIGVCIITDPRVANSNYGRNIVDDMPVIPKVYHHLDQVISNIKNFLG